MFDLGFVFNSFFLKICFKSRFFKYVRILFSRLNGKNLVNFRVVILIEENILFFENRL